MNNHTGNVSELLSVLSKDFSEEELTLSTMQAMIAAEISMKRQLLGLSQKQFAEKMHVTQALVSKWESGDVNYTLKTLIQIAFALNIKVQSPYILPPPAPRYSKEKNNLVSFSDYRNSYKSFTSLPRNSAYARSELDLEEM